MISVCFKIFDVDNDGVLNEAEVSLMIESMLEVAGQTKTEDKELVSRRLSSQAGEQTEQSNKNSLAELSDPTRRQKIDTTVLTKELLSRDGERLSHLTLEDFLVWTVDNNLPKEFCQLVFQLCHVVLGLRPCSRREEGGVVRGWLAREERAGLAPGQVWYLLPMHWWTSWHAYVNWCEGATTPMGTLSRKKNNTLNSTLASDSSSKVVATGYTPLVDTESRPTTPVRSGTPAGDSTGKVSRQSSTPGGSPATPRKNYSTPNRPGMIDNSGLIQSSLYRGITVLTGEGGKLKNSGRILRGRDYELVPERLWKFLSQMYGGSPALPRQVIRTKTGQVELELNPQR